MDTRETVDGEQRAESLADLLRATSGGDSRALARIYQLAAPKLFALALSIVKSRARAEEVLQDAFTSIWRNAHRFDPGKGAPMTWMITITRNRALTSLRSLPPEDPMDEIAGYDQWVSPGADPLEETMRRREARDVAGCMGQLEARHREVLLLAYVEGFTHQELSRRLSVPLGTVKSWIRRGLELLRDCLANG
jgi:RNA polymerase sigma-70 factor, ECF subfamily